MKCINTSFDFHVLGPAVLCVTVFSCSASQPPYECAARNTELYQVRYYPQSSTCSGDPRFMTGSLYGTKAGMETYVRISFNDGGSQDVVFYDNIGKVDRSATKLGLRLGTLLKANVDQSCDNVKLNVCSDPDPDFGCDYCVTIVGNGGPGTTYTLPDGSNAQDTPLPTGQPQGVLKPYFGGLKRISLSNSCAPVKQRSPSVSSDPNLFLMLPRISVNDVCTPLNDGIATSQTIFPEVKCNASTMLDKVSIETTLSQFKLVSSPQIPGSLAKGMIEFVETIGVSNTCTSTYKIVIMNPQTTTQPPLRCNTNLECSPIPVPGAVPCATPTPAPDDQCYTVERSGRPDPNNPNVQPTRPIGASNVNGSGLSPFLFRKYQDGGYDLRDTCDPLLKSCIWDADAGI